MSTPDSSTPDTAQQPATPQSPLSEAVEQATDTVKLLYEDLAGLSKRQANRLSSGNYGLDDLVGGGFELVRMGVTNATRASQTIASNVALLASTPPDPAFHDRPTCELKVAVEVPATGAGGWVSSDLVGRRHGFRVPGSSIVRQEEAADTSPAPAATAAAHVDPRRVLILTIDFGGAPNDIYDGAVQPVDSADSTPFMVPLAEFGAAGSRLEVRKIF